MSTPNYYSLPQAPGQYQGAATGRGQQVVKGANIHDKIADRKDNCTFTQKHLYVMGIEVVAFAYCMCIYIILEGIFIVVYNDPTHYADIIKGPFATFEVGVLVTVGYGNIVAGIIGIGGFWLGSNLLQGWRRLAPIHNWLATSCVITVIAWRGLVSLVFAPWVGVLLAFTVPEHDRFYPYLIALGYILWSIWITYILTMAFKEISHDTREFQMHLNHQRLHERKFLLRVAAKARLEGNAQDGEFMHDHELEPHLFGVLPLSETVGVYTLVIAVATLLSFVHIAFNGQTAGGWAFFAPTPTVMQTYTLELFLYPICFVCAVLGVMGTATFGGFGFLEENTALNAIVIFLASSAIRFALTFSITGMNLIERDECGVYVNGVSRLAMAPMTPWDPASTRNNSMLHCTPMSGFILTLSLVFMILDAYMIWGTFQMHHHASDWLLGDHDLVDHEQTMLEQWMEAEGILLSGADAEAATGSRYYDSTECNFD